MRFERQRTVEWGDCDPAGIVFYPNFYRMFDANAHELMEAHGFGQQDMIEVYRIVGFPLVETHAEFKRPVRWGEQMTISSEICSIANKTFMILHEIQVQEKLCVTGYEVRIWGIKDPRSDRLRALELPRDFKMAFEASQ